MSVKMLGYLHGARLIQPVPEKDRWTDSASPTGLDVWEETLLMPKALCLEAAPDSGASLNP